MKELLKRLSGQEAWSKESFRELLEHWDPEEDEQLFEEARRVQRQQFGNRIYIRGLIEISSYCRNDCYYCGIRRSNCKAERYRLTKEEILNCASAGWRLGFHTFVLQGGEDAGRSDEEIAGIVEALKQQHPGCAVTLSLGEREREVYRRWKEAGADRYLLRHETADREHYRRLHPPGLSLEHRKRCLYTLKELGYQVGAGMMIGSPGQTADTLAQDLFFLQELKPQMIGIGPFLPHQDTPFRNESGGSLSWTLRLLAILRLRNPKVLLPATTALGTLTSGGREKGILAGANVVMPNLSPAEARRKYLLYDNKLSTGAENGWVLNKLKDRMRAIGYEIAADRGDYPGFGS